MTAESTIRVVLSSFFILNRLDRQDIVLQYLNLDIYFQVDVLLNVLSAFLFDRFYSKFNYYIENNHIEKNKFI
jgi:hypothetical protein